MNTTMFIAMVWMCVSLQNLYVDILTPQDDGTRKWGLGRCLGHEGGVFKDGIFAVIKETPESFFAPFYHVRKKREVSTKKMPSPTNAGTLSSDFQPLELWGISAYFV